MERDEQRFCGEQHFDVKDLVWNRSKTNGKCFGARRPKGSSIVLVCTDNSLTTSICLVG